MLVKLTYYIGLKAKAGVDDVTAMETVSNLSPDLSRETITNNHRDSLSVNPMTNVAGYGLS